MISIGVLIPMKAIIVIEVFVIVIPVVVVIVRVCAMSKAVKAIVGICVFIVVGVKFNFGLPLKLGKIKKSNIEFIFKIFLGISSSIMHRSVSLNSKRLK